MSEIIEYLPALFRGLLLTALLTVVSGALGTIIGLVFGIGGAAPSRIVRFVSAIYPNFIRGIPILVLLLFLYFALPIMVPALAFNRFYVAIVGLTIYAGAYMAEIFRGSINAIPPGQSEASSALAMTYYQTMIHVVLPQALKVAIPSAIGFLIALVKATSLVSVIGFIDLTAAGKIASTHTQAPLSIFIIVAALYFLISYPISLFGRWYERRLT